MGTVLWVAVAVFTFYQMEWITRIATKKHDDPDNPNAIYEPYPPRPSSKARKGSGGWRNTMAKVGNLFMRKRKKGQSRKNKQRSHGKTRVVPKPAKPSLPSKGSQKYRGGVVPQGHAPDDHKTRVVPKPAKPSLPSKGSQKYRGGAVPQGHAPDGHKTRVVPKPAKPSLPSEGSKNIYSLWLFPPGPAPDDDKTRVVPKPTKPSLSSIGSEENSWWIESQGAAPDDDNPKAIREDLPHNTKEESQRSGINRITSMMEHKIGWKGGRLGRVNTSLLQQSS